MYICNCFKRFLNFFQVWSEIMKHRHEPSLSDLLRLRSSLDSKEHWHWQHQDCFLKLEENGRFFLVENWEVNFFKNKMSKIEWKLLCQNITIVTLIVDCEWIKLGHRLYTLYIPTHVLGGHEKYAQLWWNHKHPIDNIVLSLQSDVKCNFS